MIYVVSGLPRSGTSMMMQMLQAGGLPLMTDKLRKPDENNPHGYLELEAVKQLHQDQSWMPQAEGKVIKVVAPLLTYLPPGHEYRIVFMDRPIAEVLQSQQRMLQRLGQEKAAASDQTALARAFEQQVARTRQWLPTQPHMAVLYVPHHEVIANPAAQAARINAFLGGTLDEAAMVAAVDPTLYRERRR